MTFALTWLAPTAHAGLINNVDGIDIYFFDFDPINPDPVLNLLVDNTIVEFPGNGSFDGTFSGLLFTGEYVDLTDHSIQIVLTNFISGKLRIQDINPALIDVTSTSNAIVSDINFGPDYLEFLITQPAGISGSAELRLTFAVAEPPSGSLIIVGIGALFACRRLHQNLKK